MMKDIIKKALEDNNMTQKELAARLYVTPQAVSQWIKGEKRPTLDNIQSMSSIFGDDFLEKVIKKGFKGKDIMKKQPVEIKDLDTFEKAQIEAKNILDSSGIQNYSYAAQSLLLWLITAVIGMVYHRYLHHLDEEETNYNDIYFYLNDVIEESGKTIEQDFFLMGGDLFESFGDNTLENHDYAYDSMDLWYKFKKGYDYDQESDFNREFKIALLDVITKNSAY